MARYTSSPRSRKITIFPLPPKNAEVVQKLHPIGQPTEGMIVAAVCPLFWGAVTPKLRVPKPETISGC